jgi:hypothetical protein
MTAACGRLKTGFLMPARSHGTEGQKTYLSGTCKVSTTQPTSILLIVIGHSRLQMLDIWAHVPVDDYLSWTRPFQP